MSDATLFSRRLLFTVGKGGVGRTTITLALALAAARRGKQVLVVEFEGPRSLEKALGELRRGPDAPAELARIEICVVDGQRALEEYLALVVPVRRLLDTIFKSTIYRYFVAAAPGLKELMAIGKIWYEADRLEREGTGPDLVVVDAPATGHGLQFLGMPQAAAKTFSVGLVHREAERVAALLRDEKRTGAVLVTLPEEMAANEAIEMSAGLAKIGMAQRLLVVNEYHEPPCEPEELEALEAALPGAGIEDSIQPAAAATLATARVEMDWALLNETQVGRLEEQIQVPMVVLPFVFCEEFSTEEMVHLSACLEAEFPDTDALMPAENA
ncbi:MAG: ArsA-related P-loop ATPase [Deltaproteobacteria bacterium]